MTLYEKTWSEQKANETPRPKHYVQLLLGAALPGNAYGSVSPNQNSGFALTGFAGQLSGGYLLTKHLGLSAILGHYTSAIRKNEYLQNFLYQLSDENSYVNYIWAQKWQNHLFTIGPYFSFSQQKMLMEIYLQGGVVHSRLPKIVVSGFDGENNFLHIQQPDSKLAFALTTGAGIGYLLPQIKGLRLVVKADIMGAIPGFSKTTELFTPNLNVRTTGYLRQPVGAILLSTGIRYEFSSF
ncbi:MAG: hypothetical protein IPM47_08235 [Sphingobacteriales bacterium]|nr:MAG: hypothetical protein IPM47_08235 [Sphingobacteriales bacterium]